MFLNVWLMVSEAGRVGTNTGWTCSNFWICQIQKRFILWWKHKEQLSRPPGEQKSKKTPPANPRRSLFEDCFKSYFDTARWWEMSCAFDFLRNYWFTKQKFARPLAFGRVRPSLKGGTESARFGCAESLAAQCVDRIAGLHCPLAVKLALRLLCVWCYVAVATWFCFCFAFTSLLQQHAVASSSSSSSKQ